MRIALVVGLSLLASPVRAQQQDSLRLDVSGRVTTLGSLAGLRRDTISVSFHDGPVHRYSGARASTVLERGGLPPGDVRGRALAQYVVVEGADGYRVVFGLAELDSSLVTQRLLLADSVDGHALTPNEGRLRLVVAGDRGAARSARMVVAIRVVSLPASAPR